MAAEAELARALRRFLSGVAVDTGAFTPETLDNQATPRMSTGDAERSGRLDAGRSSTYADRDDTGPAYRNAPNFLGWRRQHAVELQGVRESFLDMGAPAQAATVTLDPNVVTNFFLKPAGDVTIAFAAPEDLTGGVSPPTSYLYGIKVWVLRVKDKKVTFPSGILWDSAVLDPDGDGSQSDSLLGPATAAAWENYTFVIVPGIGTWGYLSSHNGATATA